MRIGSYEAGKLTSKNISFKNKGRIDTRVNYGHVDKYSPLAPTYDTFTGLRDKTTLLADIGRRMYKRDEISIGMFDMDNFKSINELLGYKVGDEFIKAISDDISTVARKHGVDAYRFGGDEFVVLLFSGSTLEEKMEVIDDIVETTSKNSIIQSRRDDYMNNANIKLEAYEKSNSKIKELLNLIAQRDMLYELFEKGTIAKEDPYLQTKLLEVDSALQDLYSALIRECLENEKDEKVKGKLKASTEPVASEYLIDKYDRSHELYRVRKWIRDFNKNGFNITGGVAIFKPSAYKGKQPIDLINTVGEYLKNSKENKSSYYVELV